MDGENNGTSKPYVLMDDLGGKQKKKLFLGSTAAIFDPPKPLSFWAATDLVGLGGFRTFQLLHLSFPKHPGKRTNRASWGVSEKPGS